MCTINKRVSCEAWGVREPASGCTWCSSRHRFKWFSARLFHTRASPWCKSAQRPQRVGLICVKYTPAGAERKRALPLSCFPPPVQILTALATNPAPWERLCPLFFGIPSVRELSQVSLWIKASFQQGETYKSKEKSLFFMSALKSLHRTYLSVSSATKGFSSGLWSKEE